MFTLHPQLQQDSLTLGHFQLSRLLLSRDANYPWCILVPARTDVTEIHHLAIEDRQQLLVESCQLSEAMVDLFTPDKMNIAVLGNIVPQLHMHHVARYRNDPAWPGPIWGALPSQPYKDTDLNARAKQIVDALIGEDFTPERLRK